MVVITNITCNYHFPTQMEPLSESDMKRVLQHRVKAAANGQIDLKDKYQDVESVPLLQKLEKICQVVDAQISPDISFKSWLRMVSGYVHCPRWAKDLYADIRNDADSNFESRLS